MINKIKDNIFLKNSLYYTLGSMMTPLLGFILLPFYTNHLNPAEYGTLTTIQTLVGLLQILITLSLYGAISRYYYDYKDNFQKLRNYIGSIINFTIIFSLGSIIILYFFKNYIGSFILGDIQSNPYFLLMILLSFFTGIFSLPQALLRAQEKALQFVIINFIKTLSTMILTIVLIKYYNFGADGALYSQLLILILITIYSLINISNFLSFTLDISAIKESVVFSLPLIPHVASAWVISSSDRILIERFLSVKEVGIYSIAAQMSLVLSMFYSSLYKALVPRYTILMMNKKTIQAKKLLKNFIVIILVSGVISIPIADLATRYLLDKSFHEATKYIPFLIISQVIYGFYYVFVAKLFYYKKSRSIATSSIMAATTNFLLNLVLIPTLGLYGAVITTIIAELIRVTLIYKRSKIFEK